MRVREQMFSCNNKEKKERVYSKLKKMTEGQSSYSCLSSIAVEKIAAFVSLSEILVTFGLIYTDSQSSQNRWLKKTF